MDTSGWALGRSKYLWVHAPNIDCIPICNKAFESKDYEYDADFYLLDKNHDIGRAETHIFYGI